ncbi:PAS domain S-box protein [Aquiflexum sp. LQ15W]|uniref:PAS domain-containing hybrid sensor histidine kinase/response regulator n=1 Tax=Cognataquiflexum nitidum TaxID=2922272 RepID=UPI001F130A08|nr:PAS domain S-box protein [Cognataquiflexum nitidum]MCH6200928.1 PAS domain S-box protein [Cognataquiflexum nitidum]
MKERGINNTFKKIIYESSEMVFLADDTYPYNIFYTNEAFDKTIGDKLVDKTLVGLGLDINSYIFSEEMIISFHDHEFAFNIELPQDNGSNYFLFYKGKEMRTQGMPNKKETGIFFKNVQDLIGIGQENFLTWISDSVKDVLGYSPDEMTNVELCQFFHPEDLPQVQQLLFSVKNGTTATHFEARMLSMAGDYKWVEWNVNFLEGVFYAVGRDVTQEKLLKEEVKWKNELTNLGEIVSKSGVWEVSLPENKVILNEGLCAIFESERVNSISIEEINTYFQPDSRPVFQKALTELMAIGRDFDLKLKIITKKSKEKWVRIIGKGQFKENTISKVFGTIRDISDENDLMVELGLYKEMFEHSPESILISDISGNIIFTNQEANQKLGTVSKQDKSYKIGDFETRFTEEVEWEKHIYQLTNENNLIYKTQYSRQDKSTFHMEVNCRLVEINKIKYVLSFARDITERVGLEQTLQESSEFLLHLTEQVPGALYQFVLDKEGQMKFSYLSPGIKELLGIKEGDLKDFSDIGLAINKVHPEDIALVLTSTVTSARTLRPWNCQFRVKESLDGQFKWVYGAAKPEQLENGDVVWYGYLTDITDQKKFEENLKNAREQAERASQIKSEFLSMISHELRTPLNAISGSVYTLLQDDHTSHQASALNTINFAVDNLIIMINDLLDYQKIEAGKLTLENNPMNLKEVVNQVVKGLEFHAKDSRNKLILNIQEELNQEVKGDKVRLAQVLNNLVTNALKFTNNGEVEINVKLSENSEERIKVYFSVKDTGIGIAKEHQSRIFNQFDQIQHSFSKKYGGTGLGLSITKRLLEQMGSQIGLESELGLGSIFFFEIVFDKTKKQIVPVTPKENGSMLPLSKIKLLMAEDNDVNALVLGKIIKKWGIDYDRVNNGQEAVDAIKNEKYDCVLMDIQMPVMDGFEATKIIKSISNVPVLALSAAAKQDLIEKIDQSGFTGYVSKPIDASELLKKIKEVLNQS